MIIGAGVGGLYALHHLRDKMGLNVRALTVPVASVEPGGTTATRARGWMRRQPLLRLHIFQGTGGRLGLVGIPKYE